MIRVPFNQAKERRPRYSGRAQGLLFLCCVCLALMALASTDSFSGQTRSQCDECCRKAGYDEYYQEQCILKCFRDNDHCTGKTPKGQPKPAAVREPEPEPEPEPTPRRQPRFVWPNPLNLVPGKEWEAAAQIVSVNGIPPQHPNHNTAVGQVQAVLANFARTHPQGGKLPTTQLERILNRLR